MMKKQNETLFTALRAALEGSNAAEALKCMAELEGTNLTAEDTKHIAEAKAAVNAGDFAKASAAVKYLW